MDSLHYQMSQRWTLIRLFCGGGHSRSGGRSRAAAVAKGTPGEERVPHGSAGSGIPGPRARAAGRGWIQPVSLQRAGPPRGEAAKNPGDDRRRVGRRSQSVGWSSGRPGGARAHRAEPRSGGSSPSRRQPDARKAAGSSFDSVPGSIASKTSSLLRSMLIAAPRSMRCYCASPATTTPAARIVRETPRRSSLRAVAGAASRHDHAASALPDAFERRAMTASCRAGYRHGEPSGRQRSCQSG